MTAFLKVGLPKAFPVPTGLRPEHGGNRARRALSAKGFPGPHGIETPPNGPPVPVGTVLPKAFPVPTGLRPRSTARAQIAPQTAKGFPGPHGIETRHSRGYSARLTHLPKAFPVPTGLRLELAADLERKLESLPKAFPVPTGLRHPVVSVPERPSSPAKGFPGPHGIETGQNCPEKMRV